MTAKAGSISEGSVSSRAKLQFTGWPSEPSDKHLSAWLEVRKKKRAPVTDLVIERMGEELTAAAQIGWTVDQVLEECAFKGWQGFRADWLEPKPGHKKPAPARARGESETTPRGGTDYAQSGRAGNGNGGSRSGSAIERVLANARNRTEATVIDGGVGSDRGDDDGGLWSQVD